MKNVICCIYNKLSKRYGIVFTCPSEEMASKKAYKAFTNPDEIDEIELCVIGKIEIETGTIEPEAPRRIDIIDRKIPLKEAATEEQKN